MSIIFWDLVSMNKHARPHQAGIYLYVPPGSWSPFEKKGKDNRCALLETEQFYRHISIMVSQELIENHATNSYHQWNTITDFTASFFQAQRTFHLSCSLWHMDLIKHKTALRQDNLLNMLPPSQTEGEREETNHISYTAHSLPEHIQLQWW